MRTVFLVLSAVVAILGVLPYILDVIKQRTKPKLVTWFNWSLLTGIATAAALAGKQYPSAVITAATVSTLSVVIFGLRHGDRKFEPFDVYCQIGAIVGLILWIVLNSPVVAILATVLIDFIAALPTFRHIWQMPFEETPIAFGAGAIGGFLALLATHKPHFLGLVYPVYLTLANVMLFSLIINRRHQSAIKITQKKS